MVVLNSHLMQLVEQLVKAKAKATGYDREVQRLEIMAIIEITVRKRVTRLEAEAWLDATVELFSRFLDTEIEN
jgi:hypothetical protein